MHGPARWPARRPWAARSTRHSAPRPATTSGADAEAGGHEAHRSGFVRPGARYDLVIDTAGNRPVSLLRRAMTPRGTLVIVGGERGRGRLLGGFQRQLGAPLVSAFSRQRLTGLIAKERAADLEALTGLIESGAVTPVIDRGYPLADAADAIRYLHEGHAAGKVVLAV